MSVNWEDIKTVDALVRRRSLMAAGEELGVTYTTVARRVARLEAALGQLLFERTPEGYRPNETALLVVEHSSRMKDQEDDLLRRLAGKDTRLSGALTITAPQLLIGYALGPTLAQFRETYPEVDLTIKADNTLLDLTRREADLAIRISRSPGDSLKGLRLLEQETTSFAAPAWADRFANDPNATIDWIVFKDPGTLPPKALDAAPGSRVQYVFDDMVVMAAAAQSGLGVVRMPYFLGRAMPGLVEVPILKPQPYSDIWAVAHPDVWPSVKLKAFRDILVPNLKADSRLFVGGA